MAFFQHEETGGCVQTFFGNKPPSRRFYEITEKQYKMWLANQSDAKLKLNTELAETGADREMDFDVEREIEKRYEMYLNAR